MELKDKDKDKDKDKEAQAREPRGFFCVERHV